MISIGIGEIQKNISIFSDLKNPIQIVDKRKHQTLAFVYPAKTIEKSIVGKLAGKYKDKAISDNVESIKEKAMLEAMREKYSGLPH